MIPNVNTMPQFLPNQIPGSGMPQMTGVLPEVPMVAPMEPMMSGMMPMGQPMLPSGMSPVYSNIPYNPIYSGGGSMTGGAGVYPTCCPPQNPNKGAFMPKISTVSLELNGIEAPKIPNFNEQTPQVYNTYYPMPYIQKDPVLTPPPQVQAPPAQLVQPELQAPPPAPSPQPAPVVEAPKPEVSKPSDEQEAVKPLNDALKALTPEQGKPPVSLEDEAKAIQTIAQFARLTEAAGQMGGKDAVIVDETADLDAAAEGIVVSAFGFQGQKCSAGSRAIIVKDVYDKVIEKVLERTSKITIGDVRYKENWLGPVINKSSMEKIMAYIEIGKKEGQLIYGGNAREDLGGYFIEPTIFKDVAWDARIAQEEIFGPVLAIVKAEDFDDSLRIANSTEYGLTGSLYSRDRKRIERAKEEFHVGNLYFNRKCTGALVGVHPFGGFNMSGTDSKAGGRDYLGLFLQAKAISEKI